MSNQGGYTLNLNRAGKKVELAVIGKFAEEKEQEFIKEFQGIVSQINPSEYKDLIIKVGGYSTYFVDLGIEIQNEIIQRTEHV